MFPESVEMGPIEIDAFIGYRFSKNDVRALQNPVDIKIDGGDCPLRHVGVYAEGYILVACNRVVARTFIKMS